MELIKKEALKFFINQESVYMATSSRNIPSIRIMTKTRIDNNFTAWYATFTRSLKCKQIKENENICILACDDSHDLRLYGKAVLIEDEKLKKELWKPILDNFFEGIDDPNYTLIKFIPEKIEYRDYKKDNWPKVIDIAQ